MHPRFRPFAIWVVAVLFLYLILSQGFWRQAVVAFFGPVSMGAVIAVNWTLTALVTAIIFRPVWSIKRFLLWLALTLGWWVASRSTGMGAPIFYLGMIGIGAACWLTAAPRLGYWLQIRGDGTAFFAVPKKMRMDVTAGHTLSVVDLTPVQGATPSAQLMLSTVQVEFTEETGWKSWQDVRSHTFTGTAYTNDGQIVPIVGQGYTDHGTKSAVLPTGLTTVRVRGLSTAGSESTLKISGVPATAAYAVQHQFLSVLKSRIT